MSEEAKNVVQYIDGIPCNLKEPFDLSFLGYGRVFKVFDEQHSGNLCFGIEKAGKKYFVKFAGAQTINYHNLPVSDAVERLKAAAQKYRDLAHPSLIHLIETRETGNGFALIFDWDDGKSVSIECPTVHKQFLSVPIAQKVRVFEEVMRFHKHAAKRGYVAVDFNDYSVLYDFNIGKIKLCDIDFYAKSPAMNGMGRALGDPMLMSPEEHRIAGVLDEVTNVYTMGAAAFMLLSDYDRSPEKWPLNAATYAVVKKAVSAEKRDRQQSISKLITEWNAAKTV